VKNRHPSEQTSPLGGKDDADDVHARALPWPAPMTLDAAARHLADGAVPDTGELQAIVGTGPSAPSGHAPSEGWAAAATAVHAVRLVAAPVVLQLAVAGHAAILIDVRYRAFEWDVPLDRFPVGADAVIVHTEPLDPDAPPLFDLPGRDLDGLLWTMGLHAFGEDPAGWMRPGDRHRLARWPNFTELAHTPEQLRMTAMLGNAFLTADELADAAGTRVGEAQRLLNALGLMDGLRSAAGDVAPPPTMRHGRTAKGRGLFARLRDRLGR
jgi:hypothetical protein